MLATILRKKSFFEDHLVPQYRHLLDHSGRVLPLDYVALQEHLNPTMELIYTLLDHPGEGLDHHGDHPTDSTLKSHWRPHVSPGPGREKAGARVDRNRVKPTINETLLICKLYFVDYLALAIAPPSLCRGLFVAVTKSPLTAWNMDMWKEMVKDTGKLQGAGRTKKRKSANRKGKGKT